MGNKVSDFRHILREPLMSHVSPKPTSSLNRGRAGWRYWLRNTVGLEVMLGSHHIWLSQQAVVEILLALKTQNAMTRGVYSGEDVAVTFCNDFPSVRVPFYWKLERTEAQDIQLQKMNSLFWGNQLGSLLWKRLSLHFLAVISCLEYFVWEGETYKSI